MTNQHPIMPPDELVQQWRNSKILLKDALMVAAQWGADQELEACRELLNHLGFNGIFLEDFLSVRRPKPPSLKEQALEAAIRLGKKYPSYEGADIGADIETIRRALEQLND